MTILDEALKSLEFDPEVRLLYAELSAGDKSILHMLLDNDEGVGATTTDSPNSRFWRCMSEHGWMTEVDSLSSDMPMLNYRITDTGYRAIPVLLSRLVSELGG